MAKGPQKNTKNKALHTKLLNRKKAKLQEEKKEKELEKWFIKNSQTFYVDIDEEYKSCEAIKAILGEPAKK